jgi:hypothetical protein
MSLESQYQKKTDKEHILDNPDTYIGSIDTSIGPMYILKEDKIVQEVCLLERGPCPNGTTYMEGPGAASMTPELIKKNGFEHGTHMTYLALSNNPNMKIVFIRIIGNTATGGRQLSGPRSISAALKWVYDNKDKYNIQAVSMSQGHHNLLNLFSYCPTNGSVDLQIRNLKSIVQKQ